MSKVKKTNQSEQILDAAYKCISSKGYANVSLRDIANEAGVALSQLHYHFGSKKDLFREIIIRVKEKYLNEIEYRLRKETTSKDITSSLIKLFHEMLEHNPEHFRILYDLSSLALWSEPFKDILSSFFEDLTIILEESIANSNSLKEKFQRYTPNSLARMILGAILGISLQNVLDSNNNKEIIDSLNAINIVFE